MNTLEERIKTFTAEKENLKNDFAKYIADKSIPLDERWEFFIEAPDELKNFEQWIYEFKCLSIDWYDDFHFDRRQEVSAEYIIDSLEWKREEAEDEGDEDEAKKWRDIIPLIKEEILDQNMEGFCFDW
jgi:hypothetical protein